MGAQNIRAEVRERAQLLITNPDMLHQSILPVHRQFARLLSNLKYVVVDEGHAYRCDAPWFKSLAFNYSDGCVLSPILSIFFSSPAPLCK